MTHLQKAKIKSLKDLIRPYMDEKGNRVTTEHFETNENGFIEKHSGYDVILCSVCGEATIIGMNSDSETCGSFKCDNKKPSNNC
jgi:hypothetical protein